MFRLLAFLFLNLLFHESYSQKLSQFFNRKDTIICRLKVPISNNDNSVDRFGFTQMIKAIDEEMFKGNLSPFFSDSLNASDKKITLDEYEEVRGYKITEYPVEKDSFDISFANNSSWASIEDYLRISKNTILLYPWEKSGIPGSYRQIDHPLSAVLNRFEIEGKLFYTKGKLNFLPVYIIICNDRNLKPQYCMIQLNDMIEYSEMKMMAMRIKHYLKELSFSFEVKCLDGKFINSSDSHMIASELKREITFWR
jgi:hypothetical protein